MAVDLQYVWCVDFPSSSGWYSDPGNFEHMYGSSYSCTRGWVVMPADIWASALQSGAVLTGASGAATPTPSNSQFTVEEVAALKFQANNPSPFNLSISDGALVSGAIVGTWAVAWAARQFVRALGSDGEE